MLTPWQDDERKIRQRGGLAKKSSSFDPDGAGRGARHAKRQAVAASVGFQPLGAAAIVAEDPEPARVLIIPVRRSKSVGALRKHGP